MALFSRIAWSVLASLPLAACGGGGGGSPADLNVGVTLSGAWQLTSRVTATQGPCTETVGDLSTDLFTLAHDRAANSLAVRDESGLEMVANLTRLDARYSQTLAVGTLSSTLSVQLKFAPDGQSCSGSSHLVEVDGPDTCVVDATITGVRTTFGRIDVELQTTGVDPVAGYDLVVDGAAPVAVPSQGIHSIANVAAGTHTVQLIVPTGQGYLVTQPTTQTVQLTAGAVGHVAFDVARRTTAVAVLDFDGTDAMLDRTGNGHDGTALGVTVSTAPGDSNPSALFPSGTRIEIANSGDFHMNVGDAFTWSVWVQTADNAVAPILAKSPRNGITSSVHVPVLYKTATNFVHDNYFISALSRPGTQLGAWVHVAVTHDGAGLHRMYVNGVFVGERGFQAGNEGANNEQAWEITLGQSFNGFPGGTFVGRLDEFAFFQRALSDLEIGQLSQTGPDGL